METQTTEHTYRLLQIIAEKNNNRASDAALSPALEAPLTNHMLATVTMLRAPGKLSVMEQHAPALRVR